MGVSYQTEYSLGRRGRISRSYTGLRAVMAIGLDLFLLLTVELGFGLMLLALRLLFRAIVLLVRAMVFLLSLPLRFARWISRLFLRPGYAEPSPYPVAGLPLKPAWAGYDEL